MYWCSVLSIIFARCCLPRTELLWGPNSQSDFYGDVTLPLTVQSRCYCGNVHGVFVHISVRFLYVQNRKSFCHCRSNWGDVNLLSRVGFWLMLRKMCFYYKHPKDMIRIVDVGFLWPQHFNKIVRETTCDSCIACVTFFLHETSLLLVSLFYGKCYVTML